MSKQRFFICKHCGNLVGLIEEGGGTLICCSEAMTELIPNTVEAAGEKHLPVYKKDGEKLIVTVGAVEHPMTAEHRIVFIYLQTDKGGHKAALAADGKPRAEFCLCGEKPLAVYEYCNLHGLWKAEIK